MIYFHFYVRIWFGNTGETHLAFFGGAGRAC